MTIKCSHCGRYILDTDLACPYCNQYNSQYTKNAKKEPQTISELLQWYREENLPPPFVTRVFIGMNYQEPKAFGIYYDSATRQYIVYKNKASGERAIRYCGPDEAYAVSILCAKVKEMIAYQKNGAPLKYQPTTPDWTQKQPKKNNLRIDGNSIRFSESARQKISIAAMVGCAAFVLVTGGVFGYRYFIGKEPWTGYYSYNGSVYYFPEKYYDMDKIFWFPYDSQTETWDAPVRLVDMPVELQKQRTAHKYYLGDKWKRKYHCEDFENSIYYAEIVSQNYHDRGYYNYEDQLYYQNDDPQEMWYVYDTEWKAVDAESVPSIVKSFIHSRPYYLGETDPKLPDTTPFEDTLYYQDIHHMKDLIEGYYKIDQQVYYNLKTGYGDEAWYAYNDAEQCWEGTYINLLPEELRHTSLVHEYIYQPNWEIDPLSMRFEKTDFYKEYHKATNITNYYSVIFVEWANDGKGDYLFVPHQYRLYDDPSDPGINRYNPNNDNNNNNNSYSYDSWDDDDSWDSWDDSWDSWDDGGVDWDSDW